MAKPEQNSYVITVVLRGVDKAQALQFAGQLELVSETVGVPYPETVLTAHLKDED